MPAPLAALGNSQTYALFGPGLEIRRLAFPWADAAETLGPDGFFDLAAENGATLTRELVGEAAVMHTLVETATGKASIVDFLPMRAGPDGSVRLPHHRLVRVIEGRSGEVAFRLRVGAHPGGSDAELAVDRNGLIWSAPDGSLILQTEAEVHVEGAVADARFVLKAGEKRHFVFTWVPEGDPDVPEMQAAETEWDLDGTFEFWLMWARRAAFDGPQRGHVLRVAALLRSWLAPSAHQHGPLFAGPYRLLAPVALAAWGWEDALGALENEPLDRPESLVQAAWLLEALSVGEASGVVEAHLLLPHWERLRGAIDGLAALSRSAIDGDDALAAWSGLQAGLAIAEDLLLPGDLVDWKAAIRAGYERVRDDASLGVAKRSALGLGGVASMEPDVDAAEMCWRIRACLATSGYVQARRLMDQLLLERSPFELALNPKGEPELGTLAFVLWTAAEIYLRAPDAPARVTLPEGLGD